MMVLVCLTRESKHLHAPANRRGLGTDVNFNWVRQRLKELCHQDLADFGLSCSEINSRQLNT